MSFIFAKKETPIYVKASELKPSWKKKINPIWWFGNDLEPIPMKEYRPNDSQWKRILAWRLRNFMYNFFSFVIGVVDRDQEIYGMDPLQQDAFLPVQKSRLVFTYVPGHLIFSWFPLPFWSWWMSYDSGRKQKEIYVGWYFGRFGIKNRKKEMGKNFPWEEPKLVLPAESSSNFFVAVWRRLWK
jgi:hypothetical protein